MHSNQRHYNSVKIKTYSHNKLQNIIYIHFDPDSQLMKPSSSKMPPISHYSRNFVIIDDSAKLLQRQWRCQILEWVWDPISSWDKGNLSCCLYMGNIQVKCLASQTKHLLKKCGILWKRRKEKQERSTNILEKCLKQLVRQNYIVKIVHLRGLENGMVVLLL